MTMPIITNYDNTSLDDILSVIQKENGQLITERQEEPKKKKDNRTKRKKKESVIQKTKSEVSSVNGMSKALEMYSMLDSGEYSRGEAIHPVKKTSASKTEEKESKPKIISINIGE